jgi:hypothetical protein
MIFFNFFFLVVLLIFLPDQAESFTLWPVTGPHRLFIGPEFYYAQRTREGGSKQTGWLYGGHATFERRKHCGLYYAIDAYYAIGNLKGKTASGSTLKSEICEREIEGRLGYSLTFNKTKKYTLIPYCGYGDFYSSNDFKRPSPIIYEDQIRFQYGVAGFDASFFPSQYLECGINFNAKYMIEGKCKVKDDPDFDDINQIIESKIQYEVDLPFRYYTCWKNRRIVAIIAPFYRFQHYGGRMNWPFDFIDTKFSIYGAKLQVNVIF